MERVEITFEQTVHIKQNRPFLLSLSSESNRIESSLCENKTNDSSEEKQTIPSQKVQALRVLAQTFTHYHDVNTNTDNRNPTPIPPRTPTAALQLEIMNCPLYQTNRHSTPGHRRSVLLKQSPRRIPLLRRNVSIRQKLLKASIRINHSIHRLSLGD